jgi:hypothetical protein
MFDLAIKHLSSDGALLLRISSTRPVGYVEHRTYAASVEDGITDLLIYEFAQLADDYVSDGMELVPNFTDGPLSRTFDLLSLMVVDLGRAVERITCDQLIQHRLPLGMEIIGKKSWSGYPDRRAQFDQLTAFAAVIHARTVAAGAESCTACLYPTTGCTCTPPANGNG